MILPDLFLSSMEDLFAKAAMSHDWPSFLAGFDRPWKRAWRVQKAKISAEAAASWLAAEAEGSNDDAEADHEATREEDHEATREAAAPYLKPVPWSTDGYYLPFAAEPGKSTAYRLGLLYIQEASAMLPAEVLAAKPGETVLDLCAAPGGKSSQTAARLGGQGLLVANDISENRARILQRNLEQQGLRNCLVTHADPVSDFPMDWNGFFDAIQLDAPCSGEGMFRRDPAAVKSWEKYGPLSIRETQDALLDKAADLLKEGGRLVYSTCTFNTYENEEAVTDFLLRHPDFQVLDPRAWLPSSEGLRPGIVIDEISPALSKACRVWPQDGFGEGHFCVCLQKGISQSIEDPKAAGKSPKSKLVLGGAEAALAKFCEENLVSFAYERENLRLHKNWLYLLPAGSPSLGGVHVLKSGCFLGELKQKKGEPLLAPSHSFLLELGLEHFRYVLRLGRDDQRVHQLFGGQTIHLTEGEQAALAKAAYFAIAVEAWPLCWGRRNGSTVKNLYPAGWVR